MSLIDLRNYAKDKNITITIKGKLKNKDELIRDILKKE